MDPKEYFNAIRNCPDDTVELERSPYEDYTRSVHRLTGDFGIYDDYPIIFGIDEKKLKNFLKESCNFIQGPSKSKRIFNYVPGTIIASFVRDYRELIAGLTNSLFENEEAPWERFQHKSGFYLHHYQGIDLFPGKINENHSALEMIAEAIVIIGSQALDKRIPFCMPRSRGWRYLDDKSRIVVYDPREEEVIKGN